MTLQYPLFPKHIELFIGGRDLRTGAFIPHITKNMSLECMRTFLAETFDLVPQEDQQSQSINLSMQTVLNSILNNFLVALDGQGKYLVDQLVEYDQKGVFLRFQKTFERINKGTLVPPSDLQMGLSKLLEFHFKKFLNINDMIPGEPPRTRNYVSNTAEMRSHFSILVNVLLMSILCDFHEDKKYFKEEIILGNRIKEIKKHLFDKIFCQTGMGSGYYQQYVVKCYLFNKNQYARIKIVTGQEITDSYALQFILNNADTSVKAYETHTESTIYKFQLIDNLDQHFQDLLEMLGLMNMVESIYLDYKSRGNEVESADHIAPVHYQILLNQLQLSC